MQQPLVVGVQNTQLEERLESAERGLQEMQHRFASLNKVKKKGAKGIDEIVQKMKNQKR
jgi:hypothetical protein